MVKHTHTILMFAFFMLNSSFFIPVLHAATVQLPATGQTTCYDAAGAVIPCAGTGQDGDTQAGVAWPSPRFTDNANGTITDNLTGLIWLKDANCFGGKVWADAIAASNNLANGACGLTDGSSAGQWRLPNAVELESLVDAQRHSPALPTGHPFSNFLDYYYSYWSSSTDATSPFVAWFVGMSHGYVSVSLKGDVRSVWPVRGEGN